MTASHLEARTDAGADSAPTDATVAALQAPRQHGRRAGPYDPIKDLGGRSGSPSRRAEPVTGLSHEGTVAPAQTVVGASSHPQQLSGIKSWFQDVARRSEIGGIASVRPEEANRGRWATGVIAAVGLAAVGVVAGGVIDFSHRSERAAQKITDARAQSGAPLPCIGPAEIRSQRAAGVDPAAVSLVRWFGETVIGPAAPGFGLGPSSTSAGFAACYNTQPTPTSSAARK